MCTHVKFDGFKRSITVNKSNTKYITVKGLRHNKSMNALLIVMFDRVIQLKLEKCLPCIYCI